MLRQELLTEIARLRIEIALQPHGSMKIEELEIKLIMAYENYVRLIEGNVEKRKAA